jgi:aspartyl-tRNA(Asn)/glutamyl-tRNA(Gln) amidotransferase subunit C
MAITRTNVLHIAKLARLELADSEVEHMMRDLDKILAYVALLDELDTSDVPATAHVAVHRAPARADLVVQGLDTDTALAEAPRKSDEGFAVPAFMDES